MDDKAEFFINAGKTGDEDELMDELNEMEALALEEEMDNIEVGTGHVEGIKAPGQKQ
jgi:hypothetical protein